MPAHWFLEGALPCSSVRSAAWQRDWLLIGTASGSLKTLKIPAGSPIPDLTGSANSESIISEEFEACPPQCRSAQPTYAAYLQRETQRDTSGFGKKLKENGVSSPLSALVSPGH
ncbi:hypothetical protein EPH_0003010 [Eimeria praecox]|uniref:Uncharacterized protein n=1 Tax=Eimeria praecox TaxID=51316 RepID=U6G323_9EIME|nr:hypothetical protein EPH_0003010 [Eimeria praecox]